LLRRLLRLLAVVSALGCVVVGTFAIRGRCFAVDRWYWSHWSPATRTYEQLQLALDGGLYLHGTTAVVPSATNAAPLVADTGGSGWTFAHDERPPDTLACPTFWVDRYRSCPARDGRELTMSVMADLWTVECSDAALLALTGTAPTLWIAVAIIRAVRRRGSAHLGFAVIQR
jgi:hypothetical protein